MASVADNLSVVKARIQGACIRAGRSSSEVRLVGVTKTVSPDRIREGIEAGITHLGENYVQEATKKVDALSDEDVSWHFIGHLQSNKVKTVIDWCSMIHTVDRESLALEIDRQAGRRRKTIPVLLQVNIGDEETKSGVDPEDLQSLFRAISRLQWLDVRGLMVLPPYDENPELARPYFASLRELLQNLREQAAHPENLRELSMGMSHDFEVAIEEGATLIRVGTALFGTRSTSR
jgi:hypothetical protein